MIASAFPPERCAHPSAPAILVWRAWRRITRRHVAMAFAFAVAILVFSGPINWYYASPAWSTASIAISVVETLALAFSLLICLPVADEIALVARHRWLPYLVAALVASAFSVLAASVCAHLWTAAGETLPSNGDSTINEVVGAMWIALLATFAYAWSQWWSRGQKALHVAQLEQAELGREAVALQLQAAQARVEPRFLFDTLAQVESLYATDAERADRMLDDMVVYLRAALPGLQESSSTVAKEADLARAYLAIRKASLGDSLRFDLAVPTVARDARLAPMVLLPLVETMLAHLQSAPAAASLAVDAAVDNGRLRVSIRGAAEWGMREAPALAGIEPIRERLQALHAGAASLALDTDGHGQVWISLEVPHERTDRDHR